MAQKTALSDENAREILRSYCLDLREIFPIEKGTINSNFAVETDAGPLFLRICEGKSLADVDFESALIWHLGSRGVPTPSLWRTRTGAAYAMFSPSPNAPKRPAMLFSWVRGSERVDSEIGEDEAFYLGALLGEFHRVAEDFSRRRVGIYTLSKIAQRIERIKKDPRAQAELASLSDELLAEAERLQTARSRDLPSGIGHGDLFPDNFLFPRRLPHKNEPRKGGQGGQTGYILDLEQAATMPYVYDLAVTLLSCTAPTPPTDETKKDVARIGPLALAPARALLAGYESLRALSEVEWQGLYEELRYTALRFTVTRLTDISGYGRAPHSETAAVEQKAESPELPRRFSGKKVTHSKDFRDFLWRARALAALDGAALCSALR